MSVPQKLDCKEPLIDVSPALTVGDFWSWAYSDILSNTTRAVFAKFLVASALGVTDRPRIEWDSVDVSYLGKTLEVKCSAYLQSWSREGLSAVRFDIGRKLGWDYETNTSATEAIRAADCYVFSLYADKDRNSANILDLERWQFYVLLTEDIVRHFRDQRSVTLSRLQAVCSSVGYEQLKQRIDEVLGLRERR